MLAAEMAADGERSPRFVILVSGFVPGEAGTQAAEALLKGVTGIPSLHVIGRTDQMVPPARAHSLAALFDSASVLEHDKGHMIPSSAEARNELNRLLDDHGFRRAQ